MESNVLTWNLNFNESLVVSDPYCLWLQVAQFIFRQCGNYLPMAALHNYSHPIRNPDLLPPVAVLHIWKCIWTMREFMRICCEMFLQNRSAGIIHNSAPGGESEGVPGSGQWYLAVSKHLILITFSDTRYGHCGVTELHKTLFTNVFYRHSLKDIASF